MQEGFINGVGFTRTNSFRGEKETTFPEFFVDSVQDEIASARTGHPVYREVETVKIHMPGNMLTVPCERVNDMHRQRWPEHYARFKKGMEISHEGTPIEVWPLLNKSQVKFLKYRDVHTIEQIAGLSDLACQQLGMGFMQLRQKAKAYFDDATRMAMVDSLSRENETLMDQLSSQQTQLDQLKSLVETLNHRLMAEPANPVAAHIPGNADPLQQIALGASLVGAAGQPPVEDNPFASLAAEPPAGQKPETGRKTAA